MGIPHVKSINSWGFMASLSSAACEWFLMFMLFLDAALSYLLTRFASYCDLQMPCPLCSRIEHVFGENKRGYYWKLLCCNHREEISSSVYCSVHSRLADIHAVCPDCLMSVSRISKFNSESCRLLVAKLGIDSEELNVKSLLLPKNCSCCDALLKAKSNAQRMLQAAPVGNGASKANVKPPLPRVPGRSRFSRRDSLKRIRDKISGPSKPRLGIAAAAATAVDSMCHVGYMELKISSDTESDFALSDDDDIPSVHHGSVDSRTEFEMQQDLQKLPNRAIDDDSSPENQNQTYEPSSEANSELFFHEEGGLEEHDVAEPNQTTVTSRTLEHVSIDDGQQRVENPMLLEVISLGNSSSPANVTKDSENYVSANEMNESTSVASASGSSMSNEMNSSVTFTNTDEDKMSPSMMLVPIRTKDSRRPEGALMNSPLWLSSSDRNFSPRFSNFSPRFSSPRLQRNDSFGSDAVDMLQLASALERHDGRRESVDGITVKEIEGESVVDRLTRQVEYDKKCMKSLFKELEEERGASAIAANQAMAMITRLQEEKAALHMEALQYLRMMEEQAEYDMEALEKANELLAEREKEIQDYEAELEIYRSNNHNHIDEQTVDDPRSSENVETKMADNAHTTTDDSKADNGDHDFEGERRYISRCVENLEREFHQIPRNVASVNLENGHSSDSLMKGADIGEELPEDIQFDINQHNGENGCGSTLDNCTDDITELKNRLQTLETSHIEILEHAMKSLGNGSDGLNFLQEIAFQLRDLRNFALKNR